MVAGLGIILALLAAVGLAFQALTVRVATQHGKSSDVLVVVMSINIVIILPLTLLLVSEFGLTPLAIVSFAAAGIVGTMLGRAFLYSGINRVGASRAEPIKASMPIHATILAVLFLGEAVSALQFSGIILIVAGIALITWEGGAADRREKRDVPWIGLLFPFAAALFFGLEPIFASIGFEENTPVLVGLLIKAVAAFVTYVCYLGLRGTLPTYQRMRGPHLHWSILAGLANTGFLLSYYAGLRISDVGIVVPIMQTSPLVVVLFSAIFLRKLETVSVKTIAAAGIIVVGGILVTLA